MIKRAVHWNIFMMIAVIIFLSLSLGGCRSAEQESIPETVDSTVSSGSSDEIYGDDLTQEELDKLKEEDKPDGTTIVIESEFEIELDDHQATGSL